MSTRRAERNSKEKCQYPQPSKPLDKTSPEKDGPGYDLNIGKYCYAGGSDTTDSFKISIQKRCFCPHDEGNAAKQ